jgi:hypothetical protein
MERGDGGYMEKLWAPNTHQRLFFSHVKCNTETENGNISFVDAILDPPHLC